MGSIWSNAISPLANWRNARYYMVIAFVLLCSLLVSCVITDGSKDKSSGGMIRVPAAGKSYIQGDDAGRYGRGFRKVTLIRNFYMDRTEVTRRMYQAVMKTDENKDSLDYPVSDITWFDAVLFCNARSKAEGLDTFFIYDSLDAYCPSEVGKCRPVVEMLWGLRFDINGRGYRLPTWAEWEYALHGSDSTLFFWGNDSLGFRDYAWLREGADSSIHPVALKKPNPRGFFDIIGNVSEYLLDSERQLGGAPGPDAVDPLIFLNEDEYRGMAGGNFRFNPFSQSRVGFMYYSPSSGLAAHPFPYSGIRCARND